MSRKVLVVDDEQDVLELLTYNLKQAGYEVLSAEDGKEALWKVRVYSPDIIVLDIMLPIIDGLEVCKALKKDPQNSKIPIIMLTARANESDRIKGFESGADDYLVKPFSVRELILRIKRLLESDSKKSPKKDKVVCGDLVIDTVAYTVTYKGKPINLTAMEFKLLATLIEANGALFTRDQLLDNVWNYNAIVDTRTVDAHISRLREKLGPAGKYIQTVHRLGYRFVKS
ncbi:MAG TPA: response regulator transcription factor [Verrucomicrobiota bacterium]|nr:response regulator transcription factor [Verrucomicrobiota bacterium]